MKVLVMALILVTAGCSNQWRDADASLSSSELMAMLDEAGAASGSGGSASSLSQALNLKNDPNVAIYFADAPHMGSAASVSSLVSYAFMGQPDLTWDQIAEVRVFFLDAPSESGRQAGLVIGVKKYGANAFSYYGLYGYSGLGEEIYETVLSHNGQERLVMRSFDIEEDDLSPTIQLKAWEINSSGGEDYIGKFPSLVGFGP